VRSETSLCRTVPARTHTKYVSYILFFLCGAHFKNVEDWDKTEVTLPEVRSQIDDGL